MAIRLDDSDCSFIVDVLQIYADDEETEKRHADKAMKLINSITSKMIENETAYETAQAQFKD